MRTAKTLIRLGECPGLSESSLGAHSLCWFCHVAAQINVTLLMAIQTFTMYVEEKKMLKKTSAVENSALQSLGSLVSFQL